MASSPCSSRFIELRGVLGEIHVGRETRCPPARAGRRARCRRWCARSTLMRVCFSNAATSSRWSPAGAGRCRGGSSGSAGAAACRRAARSAAPGRPAAPSRVSHERSVRVHPRFALLGHREARPTGPTTTELDQLTRRRDLLVERSRLDDRLAGSSERQPHDRVRPVVGVIESPWQRRLSTSARVVPLPASGGSARGGS